MSQSPPNAQTQRLDRLERETKLNPGPVILPEVSEQLGAYAQRQLARGVELRLNTKVTGLLDEQVELSDGAVIKTKTVVWTAGISPNPLLKNLSHAKERGRQGPRSVYDSACAAPVGPG